MEKMSIAQFKAVKKPKYRNKKVHYDGLLFDSIREKTRYQELKLLEAHGAISDLQVQQSFRIVIDKILICRYVADFVYFENGFRVVEDSKGFKTREYIIKRKLMLAVLGIEIREV